MGSFAGNIEDLYMGIYGCIGVAPSHHPPIIKEFVRRKAVTLASSE